MSERNQTHKKLTLNKVRNPAKPIHGVRSQESGYSWQAWRVVAMGKEQNEASHSWLLLYFWISMLRKEFPLQDVCDIPYYPVVISLDLSVYPSQKFFIVCVP